MNKNLIVEINKPGNDLVFILSHNIEDIKNQLQKLVDIKTCNNTIDSLISQMENPDAFPNVMLFLNKDNAAIDINDYMKEYKDEKAKNKTRKGTKI